MLTALSYSDNIYAMKTHLFLGMDNLSKMGKRLKINTPIKENASSALGTTEINMIDYSNAFITLANEGEHVTPHIIEKITDNNDRILYEFKYQNEKVLNKWYSNKIHEIFKERLDFYYNKFDENIPYPILKIRTMKTRWGVCNRRIISITLNLNLIKYDYDCLDYVIVHELSHFVHFNHSKEFWKTVSKYYPNYKIIQKKLKN